MVPENVSPVERLFEDGLTALRKQQYTRAYDAFADAMELEPEMPEIHYNLGLAAGHLFRWDEAESCFRMAMRIHVHPNLDCMVHLGLVHLRQARWREALEDFARVLELDSSVELARLHHEDLVRFLETPNASPEARPSLCQGWFDDRLDDFVGVDPEIVPKDERAQLRRYILEVMGNPSSAREECDHTHAISEEWALRGGRDPLGVSRFLYERGLRCDCEVVAEAVRPPARST